MPADTWGAVAGVGGLGTRGVRPDRGQLCETSVLERSFSAGLLTRVRTLSVRIQAFFVKCTWSWVGLSAWVIGGRKRELTEGSSFDRRFLASPRLLPFAALKCLQTWALVTDVGRGWGLQTEDRGALCPGLSLVRVRPSSGPACRRPRAAGFWGLVRDAKGDSPVWAGGSGLLRGGGCGWGVGCTLVRCL